MDTIAAISTAPGIGGIGIIRMSGEDCFKVLDKIFKPKTNSDIKGYTIKYGNIVNATGEVIDEVLVSYFKAPKSYTTENRAELAEAGEFTKRAFLNGRIDLSQAEAVIDIINAKTDKEAKVSLKQLEGNLSTEIAEIRKTIISLLADIEATIDYPEYDIEEVTNKRILESLLEVEKKIDLMEKSFENGKIIRDGIKTAIIGRPNAGKSSLLNVLFRYL